jgi:ribosomal subunit interface protein
MSVRVSGKQIEIGEALPHKVRLQLETVLAKHFDGGADAHVVFSHEGFGFRADCTAHLDSGVVLKAEGAGKETHDAFETALENLEKQLRRYKRRLKNHHQRAKSSRDIPA